MRRVTSAGEAAHAEFAANPATAAAAPERKPRRVSHSLFREGSAIDFTSIRAYKAERESLVIGLKNREAVHLLPEDGAVIRIHLVKTGSASATDKEVNPSLWLQLLQVVVVAVQIHIDMIFLENGQKARDEFFIVAARCRIDVIVAEDYLPPCSALGQFFIEPLQLRVIDCGRIEGEKL